MPFYANVGRTPAYLEDTTTRVTSENFYWANRIIGALADGARTGCVPHVERYQEALPAATFALVRACDERVREDAVAGDDVCGELEAANDAIADECRRQTEALLDHVLYEASMGMATPSAAPTASRRERPADVDGARLLVETRPALV